MSPTAVLANVRKTPQEIIPARLLAKRKRRRRSEAVAGAADDEQNGQAFSWGGSVAPQLGQTVGSDGDGRPSRRQAFSESARR